MGVVYGFACLLVFLGVPMLVLTARDTMHEVREVFGWRTLRRMLRGSYSLRMLMFAAAIVPPLAGGLVSALMDHDLWNGITFLLLAVYGCGVMLPLLLYAVQDASGPAPRARWRQYLEKHPPFWRRKPPIRRCPPGPVPSTPPAWLPGRRG